MIQSVHRTLPEVSGSAGRATTPAKTGAVSFRADQRPRLFLTASRPGWPSKVVTPASQPSPRRRIGLQPGLGGRIGVRAVVQDVAHDLVLHRQGEPEVVEQLADVRALGDVAGANVGVRPWRRRSPAEHLIAADR